MRNLLLPFLFFICVVAKAQEPYLATAGGDGLGQYGYLERNAVTFARLERNTYNNVDFLSARWWVTDNGTANGVGTEYLYHVYNGPDWITGIGWQCGGDNYPSKRTTDFRAEDFGAEWRAGADCYVSVCAKYCDNSFYPNGYNGFTTNGAAGFNERHFKVLEVDTSAHISTATVIANTAGNCETNNANNVAGSFAIDPGAVTGLQLTGLMLLNTGTAGEGVVIPNSAFHVYYEPETGSEQYGDGNELYAGTLAGDWDGNTIDNVFGSNSLGIPLLGKTRIYILLCAFNTATAENLHINLGIINDGIFISPALDGYTKLRINPTGISKRNIVLPLKFLHTSGKRENGLVKLSWKIESDRKPHLFTIEESLDGRNFQLHSQVTPASLQQTDGSYASHFNSSANWFRISAKSDAGATVYSPVVYLKPVLQQDFTMIPAANPAEVLIHYHAINSDKIQVRLVDFTGRCIVMGSVNFHPGLNRISILRSAATQILLLQLYKPGGQITAFKLLR